ncbi:helicase RepA family protein [Photobacterium sp. J15]|uniref:helicase RepA family protein n=1 Tax=Photobacterium sp. J15 TaxID=265901 RepID=UPI0007E3EA70|nr:helicase RepA family protein [Photobacterium sp. J15]
MQNVFNYFDSSPSLVGGKPQPFKWKTGYEGYDNELSYIIDGVLPSQSFGVVYGPSGSYKSFLTIDWALSVATGKGWNGQQVEQTGVLYVVAEGGSGVMRRIKGWCNKYNGGNQPEAFFTITQPVHVVNERELFSLILTIREIEEKKGIKVGLVVFDTLARCFNGADENSTKDMNDFIAACDRIKFTFGVTVIVVHHSGKSDNGARGSSALRAACDFEYKVTRPEQSENELALSCEKMKDDEPMRSQIFKLESVPVFVDQSGKQKSTLVLLPGSADFVDVKKEMKQAGAIRMGEYQTAIWQAIRTRRANGETATYLVIKDDVVAQGHKAGNYSRTITQMVEKGLIKKDGDELFCFSNSQ